MKYLQNIEPIIFRNCLLNNNKSYIDILQIVQQKISTNLQTGLFTNYMTVEWRATDNFA